MTTAAGTRVRSGFVQVLIGYVLICGLALGFDLFADRSFGAVMLAVLPISLLALGCLLIGPWLENKRKLRALRSWFIGASLILSISIAFTLLGPEQAKTGEAIFTYAAMIMALPGSLVLPIIATAIEPLLAGNIIVRIFSAWIVCAAAGYVQWKAFSWIDTAIRQRARRRLNVTS
jgi:hypothetical protein